MNPQASSPADSRVRAAASGGASAEPIYLTTRQILQDRHCGRGTLLDIGCGNGALWGFVRAQFDRYIGVDLLRYPDFPSAAEFYSADLNVPLAALPDACAAAVVALETIEHLENPRALMREMVRLLKPGGLLVVSTPNQLSLLSLLTLVVKKRFGSFQDVHYPAHITPLLEVDLLRIAAELDLRDPRLEYTRSGRMVLTRRHYPAALARRFPRALSDNLFLAAGKSI